MFGFFVLNCSIESKLNKRDTVIVLEATRTKISREKGRQSLINNYKVNNPSVMGISSNSSLLTLR